MIQKFKKKFGKLENVVIGFGDWNNSHFMKGREPTKGIGMRKLFRRNGYDVFLVNEFRTSCFCSYGCEKINQYRETVLRSSGESGTFELYGLYKCETCKILWNRNVNSSLNIHDIVESELNGDGRPLYLRREKKAILSQLD